MTASGLRMVRHFYTGSEGWDETDFQAGLIERHPEVSGLVSCHFDPTDPSAPFQGCIRGVPRARDAKYQGRGGFITDDAPVL